MIGYGYSHGVNRCKKTALSGTDYAELCLVQRGRRIHRGHGCLDMKRCTFCEMPKLTNFAHIFITIFFIAQSMRFAME